MELIKEIIRHMWRIVTKYAFLSCLLWIVHYAYIIDLILTATLCYIMANGLSSFGQLITKTKQ